MKNPAMLREMTSDNLFSQYIELALRQEQALWKGDHVSANKAHDQLRALLLGIRRLPDRGQKNLQELLTHPSPNVRLIAAGHLLPLDELMALDALESISSDEANGLTAFSAQMLIREWRKGKLRDYLMGV